MITVIILALTGGIILTYYTIRELCKPIGFFDVLLVTLTLLMGVAGGGAIGVIMAYAIPTKKEVVVQTRYLETIQDNLSVDGSISGGFFLVTGSIKGQMQYSFYYKTDDGFMMGQLPCKDVLIKYSDGKPKVESYKLEETDDVINKFSLSVRELGNYYKHIIYVPKGTVKNVYDLDAKS